jgi:prefoldin subunit 5
MRGAIGRALVWSSRIRVLQQRLSSVADTITILNVRIRELERLRDQVEKARLAARRSSRNRS